MFPVLPITRVDLRGIVCYDTFHHTSMLRLHGHVIAVFYVYKHIVVYSRPQDCAIDARILSLAVLLYRHCIHRARSNLYLLVPPSPVTVNDSAQVLDTRVYLKF